MTTKKKVLGIAGSLRRASTSRALLRAARELAPDDVELEIFELDDVPLYNADLEVDDLPAAVVALRDAIASADAVLFASPEYNHGVSGVLKNAVDWASRPAFRSSLTNKRIALIGLSGNAAGGPRGKEQLEQSVRAAVAEVFPYRELLIGNSRTVFEGGELHDDDVRRRLTRYLQALSDWLHGRAERGQHLRAAG